MYQIFVLRRFGVGKAPTIPKLMTVCVGIILGLVVLNVVWFVVAAPYAVLVTLSDGVTHYVSCSSKSDTLFQTLITVYDFGIAAASLYLGNGMINGSLFASSCCASIYQSWRNSNSYLSEHDAVCVNDFD